MSTTPLAAVLALAAVAGSGCAHVITIESEPTGASVIVDGKHVGTTPFQLSEISGGLDRVPVEVQHAGRSARFAYTTTAVSTDAATAGVGAACLMCLGGAAGVAALPLAGFAAASGILGGGALGGPLFVALIIGGYGAYFGGILMASYAPYALVGTIGEAGRIGPERIHVDLRPAVPVVTSQPGNMVEPWVGRTVKVSGQRY
ncbi:MAG: PEGA domain-containing protein [Deltaproteobacteria bacterium]|nr:PEGA domain-containing protein [Deltaproteobacteria bacterium]